MRASLRRIFGRAFFAFGFALIASDHAWSQDTKEKPASDKTLCWKATSDSGTVYLLGSVHFGSDALYPLPKEITDAFKASKFLVVEADVEKASPEELQAMVLEKGQYKDGDKLSKHLSKESMDALKDYLKELGLELSDQIEAVKPWLLMIQLASQGYVRAGLDPEQGIDKYFLKKAKAKGKEVLELESVKQQLDLVASLGDADQEESFATDLKELKKIDELSKQLIEAWKNGDEKLILDKIVEEPKKNAKSKAFFEKMIDERNVKMVEKIEGYLKDKGPYFVVVGAGHLVGEKGIVKALEDKKYKVERIKKSAPAEEKEPAKASEGSGAK